MHKFDYSKHIVELTQKVERKIAEVELAGLRALDPVLRSKNSIKTIQATVEIEGNSLGVKEVTALFQGKKVKGAIREITEVENAFKLYNDIHNFNPQKKSDFLKAHAVLMRGLIEEPGKIRKKNVGVGSKGGMKYIAPPHAEVDELLNELFVFIHEEKFDRLVMSALIHFEIEMIHPFLDGNGRIGRFWQTLYLYQRHNKLFSALPVESVIRDSQKKYYDMLQRCGELKKANHFVEYILEVILKTFDQLSLVTSATDFSSRMERACQELYGKRFSKQDYQAVFENISTATASRDLKRAVEEGYFSSSGEYNQTTYRVKG